MLASQGSKDASERSCEGLRPQRAPDMSRQIHRRRALAPSIFHAQQVRPADDPSADPTRLRRVILLSAALTLGLYLVPFGQLLAWPLRLGATFVHELGHGLTAAALGGQFESLQIFGNGSGVARHSGTASGLASGLVAMGGLVGPAVAGAALLTLARWPRASRVVWALVAIVMIALGLTVLRGLATFAFAVAAVALSWWMIRRASDEVARGGLVFLAVQLALSVLSNADYLFTDTAHTGAGTMPSDVAVMADALGGTYWVWGTVCGAVSLAVAVAAVVAAWRAPRPWGHRLRRWRRRRSSKNETVQSSKKALR